MGCLAILTPFFARVLALSLVELLLIVCGALEMMETFRAASEHRRRSAYLGGATSVAAGILLLAQPELVLRGLVLFVAGSFLIDGLGKLLAGFRARATRTTWKWLVVIGVVNIAIALILVTRWPVSGMTFVVLLVGIHMLTTGWSLLMGWKDEAKPAVAPAPVETHPDSKLRLPQHPEFGFLTKAFQAEEIMRRRIDAAWFWIFCFVFFAIHIGRMHVEWNLAGMISPLVATVGDVATALILAFGLMLPVRLGWRKLTRPLEARGWQRLLARTEQGRGLGVSGRLWQLWLQARFRFALRMALARHSPRAALRWGLRIGLPATAILIAVNPIWGFSWFFNSESWTAGIWDRWAAARADIWRDQMIVAVQTEYHHSQMPECQLFAVEPAGVNGKDDFSFLVLGDTGEGGAAQHSLRDQYLSLGRRPDVKFLVISSDVIYPSGEMHDYEPNFYLPFKGITQPIYALPGNHDWYDALESFAANFMEPDAARACMLARAKADGWWTTTSPRLIEAKIAEAARLRTEFGASTGWQRGPFFDIQTQQFALIAVDTGVLRQVDTAQWVWLKTALERARGKFIMVILGHPLYTGGRYMAAKDVDVQGEWEPSEATAEVLGQALERQTEPFAAIHQLLREHRVDVVMAGDRHYFECYQEPYEANGKTRTMHHFVNGGGGAYMSIGVPLDWPSQPILANCAYFPRKDLVINKLDRETPIWKAPLWAWVKHLHAWPLSVEPMAGAFVYSKAPYVQSFVEVRIENTKREVRLIPHGANGVLRWSELDTFGALKPAGKAGTDTVEFVFPMPKRGKE
jgi:uncharacterized membrane protein HdeD (DUF308 family)